MLQRRTEKAKAIIADIDECFCQTEFIFDEAKEKQLSGNAIWEYFHENVHRCRVNEWCVDLIKKYAENHMVIFITARSEEIREFTAEFLTKNLGFNNFYLLMRGAEDFRPSHEVKESHLQILKTNENLNISFAIDDDPSNCEMFKKSGITTLMVV